MKAKMHFKESRDDSKKTKDLKYALRIQELQKTMQFNKIVITPNPKLRAPDRQVMIDIFDGDIKEIMLKGTKNMVLPGDPRKKQIDFMQDINMITWQSAIIKKKLDGKVQKSDVLMIKRNKFTNKLAKKNQKLMHNLQDGIQDKFI